MSSDELLSVLNAYGQQFLASFAPSTNQQRKKRKHNRDEGPQPRKIAKVESDEEESEQEWGGITQMQASEDSGESTGAENFEQEDDDFVGQTSNKQRAPVVVFQDTSALASTSAPATKAQMKAFMSSKVSRLREAEPDPATGDQAGEDGEEERSLAQNDALLHRLVHTKLLSGSLDPELDLTPAQRRKALAGRVLEAAGGAKMGKGEKYVRQAEKNKASQRVRLGMVDKQKQRDVQELDEAKDLGNYHPTIKKLFEANANSGPTPKKRDRGLKMGVGHFSGGMLRLSKDEIDLTQGTRGRGRGRGGSRGGRGRGGPPTRGMSNPDRGSGGPRGRGKPSGGHGRGRGH